MNNTDKLHHLFERLPQQTPSDGFRATLMARVHAEAKRKEHRANVIAWAWLCVAVLVILLIGACTLIYLGVNAPHIAMPSMPRLSGNAESRIGYEIYTSLAFIVGILLLGDYALRRHFKKH
jgi:hypothetical protein